MSWISESQENWCWSCHLYMTSVNVYIHHLGCYGDIYGHINIRRNRYTKKTSEPTHTLELILRGQCIKAMTGHISLQQVYLHAHLWNMPLQLDCMTAVLFCFALLESIVLDHVYSYYSIWFINAAIASQCLEDVGSYHCHRNRSQ